MRALLQICLSLLLVFIFFFGTARKAYATCYTAFEKGFDQCSNAINSNQCGLNKNGVGVCCDYSSNCPLDTEKGGPNGEPSEITCNVASFDTQKRDLKVCVGGFSSKNELRSATVKFSCVAKSSIGSCGQYVGNNPVKLFGLSSTSDSQIQCENDKCFTCIQAYSLDRQVAALDVEVFLPGSTKPFCKISDVGTIPSDYSTSERLKDLGIAQQSSSSSAITCRGGNGIDTAIGCIPIDSENGLIGFFLRWGVGIGGGIAFLLILWAGFMIMTSTGDPKRLQAGQELLTSAIGGLILLIFSVFILRVIGVDILGIPGFGK